MTILSETVICRVKGEPVRLQEIIDNDPPNYATHCVQYAGSGHYFPSKEEAFAYLYQRKFLQPPTGE